MAGGSHRWLQSACRAALTVAWIPGILCSGTSASWAGDPLYGAQFGAQYGSGVSQFGSVNSSTGAFTYISNLPNGLTWPLGDAINQSDPIDGLIFTKQSQGAGNVLAINKTTGTSAFLTLPNMSGMVGFDNLQDRLIYYGVSSGTTQLYSYNIATGTSQVIATGIANTTWQAGGIAAVNSFARTAYLYNSAAGKVYVTNIDTGAQLSTLTVPSGTLQLTLDEANQQLVGLVNTPGKGLQLETINVKTGTVNTFNPVVGSASANYVQAVSALTGTYYFQGGSSSSTITAVSTGTGAVTGSFTAPGRLFPLPEIVLGGATDSTYSYGIADPTTVLIKQGTNTVTLTGSNNYVNGTIISAGALSISSAANVGSGMLSFSNGTALNISNSLTLSNPIFVAGDPTFNVAPGQTVTVSSPVADGAAPGDITLTGGGTLILTAANTYSGGTSITAGVLQIQGAGTLGSSTGATAISGGTLDLGGTTQTQNGGLTMTGGILQNGTLSSSTGFNLQAATVSAVLAGSGAATISGAVTFAGANTYSGTTTINSGGALQIGSGGTSGNLGTGNVVNNGTLTFNRTDTVTVANSISGTGGFVQAGSGTLTLTGSNTYSGITTINSGSTLQLGNNQGGFQYIGSGAVVNNGTLVVQTAGILGLGSISGTGTLNINSFNGTVTMAAVNSYTGPTVIGTGTLVMQGTINTSVTDNGVLAGSTTIASLSGSGIIEGTVILGKASGTFSGLFFPGSSLTVSGGTETLNIPASCGCGPAITVLSGASLLTSAGGSFALTNNGTFDISSAASGVTVGSLVGSGSVVTGGKTLSIANAGGIFAGVISGSGGVTIGGGTFTLSGVNSYTGATIINANSVALSGAGSIAASSSVTVNTALDISGTTSGASIISLAGSGNVVTGSKTLTITNGSGTFAGVISGTGGVVVSGGSQTLSGANSYTGGTAVNAGTLNVSGTIGAVTVANGATLTGSGKVGATSVASGGTLSTGSAAPATLTVTGNLSLASGANYSTAITPTAAGLTAVIGTASVNGALSANAASGTYALNQTYKLISATSGVSGTFASLVTPGLPAYVKGSLSYDANDVYLKLSAASLASELQGGTAATSGASSGNSSSTASTSTSGFTANQISASSAIDAAVTAGAVPNTGIASLYTLSTANLTAALNQVASGTGAQAVQGVGQAFSPFVNLLLARGETDDHRILAANGVPDGVSPAQLEEGASDVWASVYGGHTGISANASSGAASLSSNAGGVAAGAETLFYGDVLAGASIGAGRQWFHSGTGGTGASTDVIVGLYGRKGLFDAGYISAALGYGWHNVKTLRTVGVSGTDVLAGKFNANDFGGRVEAGYRIALTDMWGVTPFAAFAGQRFHTPAYAETVTSGTANFALAYGPTTSPTSHFELGDRFGRHYETDDGVLWLEGTLGWSHQVQNSAIAQAAFESLPASGFVLLGARPANNTALLGLNLQQYDKTGLVYGAHVQGQVGSGTTSMTGTLNIGYRW